MICDKYQIVNNDANRVRWKSAKIKRNVPDAINLKNSLFTPTIKGVLPKC